MSKLTAEQKEILKRAVVFRPCKTKEHLQDWLKTYLKVDLPNTRIDPTSTSTPMDLIWEVYEKALDGTDEEFQRILAYAARDSYKSFAAALLEVLMLIHLDRDVGHMAAIKSQALRVQRYVKTFLSSPYLKPFVVAKNDSNISVVRYMAEDGTAITEKEWAALPSVDQTRYQHKVQTIEIVVATMQSANGFHGGMLVIDEVDLMTNRAAYEEAKAITSARDGKLPITFLTSSRKFSFGLVQEEIDNAKKTGTHIRNWNVLDVASACPPKRHLPLLPKIPIWVDESGLSAVSNEQYQTLTQAEQSRYIQKEGFQGCLQNCKMFSYCQGRLATSNRPETGAFYKPVAAVQQSLRQVSVPMARAQYLCFGAGTQILMGDGTCKAIEQISIGEVVVSHTGKTCRVTDVFQRSYDGKVQLVKHPTWMGFGPTIVTPEHPYLVNGAEFLEIGKTTPSTSIRKQKRKLGDYLSLPSGYLPEQDGELLCSDFLETRPVDNERWVSVNARSIQSRSLPTKLKLDYDFGWLLGYFLAEGSVGERAWKKVGKKILISTTFSCHSEEKEYQDTVDRFITSLGLTVASLRVKGKSFGMVQVVNNSAFAELMTVLCGRHCDKKRLHPKLMNKNKEFLNGVLEGFWAGDGDKKFGPQCSVVTTSYELVCQLFTIAARMGYCPRIKKKKLDPGQKKQPYMLFYQNPRYIQAQKRTKFKHKNGHNLYRFDEMETSNYRGVVYNIEVEGDNSYIANGLAVHNCHKPSSEGMVYTHFDRAKHAKLPYQIKELITDEPAHKEMTKADLIEWLKTVEGGSWYAGYDWGFSHDFVAVLGFKYGYTLYIIDAVVEQGLDATEKVEAVTKQGWKAFSPIGFPDPESPSEIKTFKKAGFAMREWKKGPGSVLEGIEVVRSKLRPMNDAPPQLYFLTVDHHREQNTNDALEQVIWAHEHYHWKQDSNKAEGKQSTKEPDEEGADAADATRYLVMNVFPIKKDNTTHAPTPEVQKPVPKTMSASFWEQVSQDVGIELGKVTREETAPTNTRKGKWIISE